MRLSHVALKEWGSKARKAEGKTKRARDRKLAIRDQEEPYIGKTGLVHTEKVGKDLVDSVNRQIRAERAARPRFVPKTIIRKRGDQDPQVTQEDAPTGEDPKGEGDSAAGRDGATRAEQYPVS